MKKTKTRKKRLNGGRGNVTERFAVRTEEGGETARKAREENVGMEEANEKDLEGEAGNEKKKLSK